VQVRVVDLVAFRELHELVARRERLEQQRGHLLPVELADAVRRAGGRYTGRETEVSGNVITARDEGAGMRFGKALAEVVRI
jgi:hypothetical protein